MRRWRSVLACSVVALFLTATPALACGGLLNPNGTITLVRTSTLAAYHEGVEHYVTSFEFVGGGAKFGSIVPLPGIPSDVQKGGDWTLQRLAIETQPILNDAGDDAELSFAGAAGKAEVILETKVDALDITILKGGGDEVGVWAEENGFDLPPDAPEVLDFYAARSPIFMAVRFDVDRARAEGQDVGEGTPVHLTIPTPNPWVPLRILGLGSSPDELIEADVYLLTEAEPRMLPVPGSSRGSGLFEEYSEAASDSLLADLRSDRGMEWLPESGMWLTKLRVDALAAQLIHDLAIDSSGTSTPSAVAAGLVSPGPIGDEDGFDWGPAWAWLAAAAALAIGWRMTTRSLDTER